MAVRIKFDSTHNVIPPTFVLANRSGIKFGVIPAYDIEYINNFNSYDELSFKVSRYNDNKEYYLWDKLQDFKLIWCREYDEWFEISVELDEGNDIIKNIEAKSLSECELSQINLYGIEINTEDDISREDYIPTILFDPENKDGSLLHRVMEKIPHYKIAHVDTSIKNIQRTFSFNGISIYDAFQEIAEEINCIFVFNNGTNHDGKIAREISVYDLESYCLECGHREDFSNKCPKCGSESILTGYGSDTEIFVSVDNLADNIKYSTDVGSVKNCFKLEAGDDLMTATIINCNPNGSGYIWSIPDELKSDMSDELVNRLEQYDELNSYYQNEHVVNIDEDILLSYNELVDKYYSVNKDLKKVPEGIIGYSALMNVYYDTIDMYLYLHDNMMPDTSQQRTNAGLEAAKLGYSSLSPVAVTDLKKASASTVNSAVLSVAKTIVDSRYQVKIKNSAYDNNIWTGNFTITNYSDEEDTAVSLKINVLISDDYQTYVEQRLKNTLTSSSDNVTNISDLFKLDLNSFLIEIKKYCLSRLESFHDSCESCINILIEQGIANKNNWENEDPNLYAALYEPYYQKLLAIEDEIKMRESEIFIVTGTYDNDGDVKNYGIQMIIDNEKSSIQNALNFEKYLGDLWLDFITYRREDTYSNDNYISDGLNNKELYDNALEFIETAQKEIYRSANLQHTISASLRNLLAMKEFEPIIDKFEVGNWIRVRVGNNVYKLRLITYTTDYENMNDISVTFSDVKKAMNGLSDTDSLMEQAKSISGSYGSVSRQASQGKMSNQKLQDWATKGLALTKMKIIDNADNQNITWDSHGLSCKEYLPLTDDYDDKQLKIINRGLYLTDDAWKTSKAGIGDFTFYNPETGEMEEAYGVIADTLVGNLVLSEKVGVYNMNNSIVMNEDGLIITNGINTVTINPNSDSLFTLSNSFKKIISMDNNGNGSFEGNITATSGYIGGSTGFFIGSTYIRNGNITNANNTTISGIYIGVDGFNISGGTTSTTSYFTKNGMNIGGKLTWDGSTLSVNGNITTGNLQATGGKIANFTISEGYLYNGISIGTVGSCGISCGSSLNGSDDWIFWAGNGVFRVNKNGQAWLTNANISGSIIATNLTVYNTISMNVNGDTSVNVLNITKNELGFGHLNIGEGCYKLIFKNMNGTLATVFKNSNDIGYWEIYGNVSFMNGEVIFNNTPTCNDNLIIYGKLYTSDAYNNTSTGAINARLCTPGDSGLSRLARSTSSSKRYKNIISQLSNKDIELLYDIPTYWFKYKKDYLSSDDERYDKAIPGFIVEDWEKIMPIAIDHNNDGSPEMWNSNIIVPLMFEMLKNEHEKNKEIEKRLLLLEKRKIS